MNIKNRQQALALFAFAAVALLASDRFVISPLTRAWKERAGRIAELKKNVAQGAKLLGQKPPAKPFTPTNPMS